MASEDLSTNEKEKRKFGNDDLLCVYMYPGPLWY